MSDDEKIGVAVISSMAICFVAAVVFGVSEGKQDLSDADVNRIAAAVVEIQK